MQNVQRTAKGSVHRLDLPGADFAAALPTEGGRSGSRPRSRGSFARLVSCHVANFGKLHNQDFEFDAGLNVIEAANGVGKTTLANFVRAMFYGFDDQAAAMGREDLRERYRPWQGGTYGGEMVFAGRHGNFKVERTFGANRREDFLAVYDLTNGERIRELEGGLGEEVFGMDADSFERSTYVARLSGPHTRPTQRMISKLSGAAAAAAQAGPSTGSYDQVAARHAELCRRSKEYSDELARIEALFGGEKPSNVPVDELRRALDDIEQATTLTQAQTEEMQAVRDFVARSAQRFSHGLPSASEIATYQDIQTNLVAARAQQDSAGLSAQEQEQLAAIEQAFAAGIPSDEDLATCQENISKVSQLEGALASLQPDEQDAQRLQVLDVYFQAGVPSDDDIQHCRALLTSAKTVRELDSVELGSQDTREAFVAKVLGGAGGITIAVGLVVAVVLYLPVVGGVIAIAGACALVIAGFLALLGKRAARENPEEHTDENEMKALALEAQARAFTEQYAHGVEPEKAVATITQLRSERRTLQDRIDHAREQASEIAAQLEPTRKQVADFLGAYVAEPGDPQQDLMRLRGMLDTRRRLMAARDEAAGRAVAKAAYAGQLEGRLVKFLSAYYPDVNPANASAMLANLAGTVSAYQEAQRILSAGITGQDERAARHDAAERRLHALCARYGWDPAQATPQFAEKLAAGASRHQVTQAKLDAVHAQLRELVATYGPPPYDAPTQEGSQAVEEGFASYIERFSGIAASGVGVDETGAIVRQQGRTHQIAELSQGYSDVIAFCMRMALGDALFEGAKPFIILDDPFVNLDDRHLGEALAFVCDLARDRQIVYLTCHTSRSL